MICIQSHLSHLDLKDKLGHGLFICQDFGHSHFLVHFLYGTSPGCTEVDAFVDILRASLVPAHEGHIDNLLMLKMA
jgi:hypothetical protein